MCARELSRPDAALRLSLSNAWHVKHSHHRGYTYVEAPTLGSSVVARSRAEVLGAAPVLAPRLLRPFTGDGIILRFLGGKERIELARQLGSAR